MSGRASGVLLHPTSLPGPYGVGDLGPGAVGFLDSLVAAGQSVWQMLPLTPPGAFESPFDSRSAFAGNWLLISPDELHAEGLLPRAPEVLRPLAPRTSYPAARKHKERMLRGSWEHYRERARRAHKESFEEFCEAPAQRFWLDDWTLFAALESRLDAGSKGASWDRWPLALRQREPESLDSARRDLVDEIGYQKYLQFLFSRQLAALRKQAHQRGIRLLGDLPFYVSYHSADVWAHPGLFELDGSGRPLAVAGVPPDAFSASGQRWGNPLYRWARHRELGYKWWIERLRTQAAWADLLRLDHFRAFVAYWRIPATAKDASGGRWARGPGRHLFEAIGAEIDISKLIVEDLGHITPAVHKLRQRFGLRGMKVLQFGFGDEDSDHLPDNHEVRSVVYTGTHDNDSLTGWCGSLAGEERRRVLDHLGVEASTPERDIAWQLVRVALDSVADLVVLPLQDVLGLGSDSRMNTPGTVDGNWRWRMQRQVDESIAVELRRLTASSGRMGGQRARAAS